MDTIDKNGVYYLSSPYSSPDPEVVNRRYLEIDEIGYKLLMRGITLIEPIAASHMKSLKFKMPSDAAWWRTHYTRQIAVSTGVIVAMMDGWDKSVGVQEEIAIAKKMGKVVIYYNPKDSKA